MAENLCLSINRCPGKCCANNKTPVTPEEYGKHFLAFGIPVLSITQDLDAPGELYLIPLKPCPHLENSACNIHDDAPQSCRNFKRDSEECKRFQYGETGNQIINLFMRTD